ncbi:MAG: ATP-binding protein [Myxococcales bacterium]|nr:PAS domain S-box protein [Myxococcales bacterium]
MNTNIQIGDLLLTVDEAEETLRAIRAGKVDGVVVEREGNHEVFTFRDPSHPYRLLVEAMSEGAALLTLDGLLSYCNPCFGDLVGATQESLVGEYLERLVHPDDRGKLKALLAAAASGAARDEVRLLRPGRAPVSVQLSASALNLSDISVLCLVVTDLTEHRRQEEMFRKARREIEGRDRLFSIAAHELRGTLGTQTLQAQLLMTRLRSGAGAELGRDRLIGIAEALQRQAKQMSELVGKLLDVGSAGSGKLELIRESVDLAEVVRTVVERSGEVLARSGSSVSLDLQPLKGSWDRVRIEQVVANLISNAAKYGHGKPIRIIVGRAGPAARLAVEDQGEGVPEEERERIFRPYERMASTARTAPGLGLGLYISEEIVKAHGGSIHVERAAGNGARFVVDLPL